MNYAFRDALMIEVSDLFTEDEIFEQAGTTIACFERVLIVVYPHPLVGSKKLAPAVFCVLLQVVDLGVVISRIKFCRQPTLISLGRGSGSRGGFCGGLLRRLRSFGRH